MITNLLTIPRLASDRRRWIALVVVCFGQLMIVLDATIVNVALPSIQRDLHFSQADLTWVVNAYMIAFASFLLMAGRLGDLAGRKKVFLLGLALFTAASALCGFAGSQGMLIAARFTQGLGGAIASSAVLALIVTEFPSPVERVKAMSAYMFTSTAGGSLGLLAGGALTQSLDWHWIFVVTGWFGSFFLGALYLEHVLHYDALQTGLAFLPMTLTVLAMSLGITARLMTRFGPLPVIVSGTLMTAIGLTLLAQAGPDESYF